MRGLLLSPITMALCVPALLLLAGAVAKKIVRGKGWDRSDVYLGVEFTLAALSSGFIHVADLAQKLTLTGTDHVHLQEQLNITALFVAVCFLVFLIVLATHQDWQARTEKRGRQFFWLIFFSNGLGAGLLVAFVVLIKGT